MSTISPKDWIDVLSALLTPIIAIVAIAIGFLQWHINRSRLKNDLFNRRIELYEIITNYITDCLIHSEKTHGKEIKFLRDTKHARFIFNKKIASFVDEIYEKSVDLNFCHRREQQLEGPSLKKVLENEKQITKWFRNELRNIQLKFEKFLKL